MYFYIAIIISAINCFQIKLHDQRKEYCISKKPHVDYDLSLLFIVSGENEKNVDLRVYKDDLLIKTVKNKSEFEYLLNTADFVKFCFIKYDNTLSQIYIQEQDVLNSHIALKDTHEHGFQKLQQNIENLDNLKNIMKAKEFREVTHRSLIDLIIDNIKFFTALKVLIIIGVCGLQFYMVTQSFKNNKILV